MGLDEHFFLFHHIILLKIVIIKMDINLVVVLFLGITIVGV